MDFIEKYKIPLGDWISTFVDFLNDHAAWFFNFISDVLGFLIEGLIDVLQLFPALLLIAIVAGFAYWLHRSLWLVVGIVLSLLLIVNIGYWEETIETLALVIFATATCMIIGVPVGIAAAHRPWLYTAIRPVLDLMQTIPTFVYLIPTLILFGLGVVPGLISTVIFAIPAPIRLTYLGISSVPKNLFEAGESFGATKRQLLWKVELPHAPP
jgi:glycine betaine/proline transport system permease protein